LSRGSRNGQLVIRDNASNSPQVVELDGSGNDDDWFVRRARRGDRGPIPTPDEALAELGPGPLPKDVMMRETQTTLLVLREAKCRSPEVAIASSSK